MTILIHPDSFKDNCAMCGTAWAKVRSDHEDCEGCAFCDNECEVQYIQFLAEELDRLSRDSDYEEEGE